MGISSNHSYTHTRTYCTPQTTTIHRKEKARCNNSKYRIEVFFYYTVIIQISFLDSNSTRQQNWIGVQLKVLKMLRKTFSWVITTWQETLQRISETSPYFTEYCCAKKMWLVWKMNFMYLATHSESDLR